MQAAVFVNHYEILGLAPGASADAIEQKFRQFARRFHPDNQATGDRAKFDAVVAAHETLKDVGRRAQYHADHEHQLPPFQPWNDRRADSDSAAEEPADEGIASEIDIERDVAIQNNILSMLYLQRRRDIREPGVGNAELERLTGCPSEHLEFHLWYLRAKGWIARGDDGLLAITIDGVDRAAVMYREGAKRITNRS